MAKSFSVTVKGLSELEKIPGALDHAQRETLEEAAREIAESVGKAAPSRSGRLRASWRGRTLDSRTAEVASRGTEYAKAIDRGAYITPNDGRALKFESGRFSARARLKPTNYVKRGLRSRGRIVRKAFERNFGELRV